MPTATTAKNRMMTSKYTARFFMTTGITIAVLLLILFAPHHVSTEPISGAECQKYFEDFNSCPDVDMDYTPVNKNCCGHTNLTLICLSLYHKEGNQEIYKECEEDFLLEKGHCLDIQKSESAERLVAVPCDDRKFYQPTDRMSSTVRYNYCTLPKSACQKEGQQQLCRGGPAADDQCVCREGYRPKGWPTQAQECRRGFGDDECSCEHSPCPEGTRRNIDYQCQNYTCKSETTPIDYTCYNITDVHSTVCHVQKITEDEGDETSKDLYFLSIIPILIIIVIIVIVVIFNRRKNQKARQHEELFHEIH